MIGRVEIALLLALGAAGPGAQGEDSWRGSIVLGPVLSSIPEAGSALLFPSGWLEMTRTATIQGGDTTLRAQIRIGAGILRRLGRYSYVLPVTAGTVDPVISYSGSTRIREDKLYFPVLFGFDFGFLNYGLGPYFAWGIGDLRTEGDSLLSDGTVAPFSQSGSYGAYGLLRRELCITASLGVPILSPESFRLGFFLRLNGELTSAAPGDSDLRHTDLLTLFALEWNGLLP